jgi:hypothetical protein
MAYIPAHGKTVKDMAGKALRSSYADEMGAFRTYVLEAIGVVKVGR